MINKIHRFFLVISIFVLYRGCFAIEMLDISGSYRFGPDVSRKEGCNEAKKESVRIRKRIASIKRYNQHTEPYLLCIVCTTGSCKIFSADSYGTV